MRIYTLMTLRHCKILNHQKCNYAHYTVITKERKCIYVFYKDFLQRETSRLCVLKGRVLINFQLIRNSSSQKTSFLRHSMSTGYVPHIELLYFRKVQERPFPN